jgi:flagellar protein FliS
MNPLANQARQHYQKTQVESASPAKLLLLLYDGAVRKLNQAVSNYEQKNREEFRTEVVKVQKILNELTASLDHEKGGEVATNLDRLYDYMIRRLGIAMVRFETEPVKEVKMLLEGLREAWQGAIDSLAQEARASTTEEEENIPAARPIMNRPIMAAAGGFPLPSLNIAG